MLFLFFASIALAVPSYIAERDPISPFPGKAYRLWLSTPGKPCAEWRKVKALIPKEDSLLSEAKRDLSEKSGGCKFTFVILPVNAPGAMRFEMEPIVGAKEFFEVPGSISNSNAAGIGQAPSTAKPRSRAVDIAPAPAAEPANQKHLNTGTGL
jgi:hypothetical protein